MTMSQASINVVANIVGQTVPIQINRSQDGTGLWTPNVAAGNAGTLSSRTDNDTGIAALSAGHGILTGDKVDVFWTGGRRYGMTATVSGNSVTVDLGAGDILPALNTALIVCKRQVVNAAFDPDDVSVLLITATRRVSVAFVDAGGLTLLALDLGAGECCLWWTNSGIVRPMSGNPVAAIWVGNGDSAGAVDVTVAAVYDATP
jgi:hypothetical protein